MNLLDSFFLSERDDDLIGKGTTRDVLGHMVLWSELGHRLIPTLTEQTTTFSGFQILISGLHVYEQYCSKYSNEFAVEEVFIVWEQLCAFSVAHYHCDPEKYKPLPGLRALRRLKGSYVVSHRTKLLDNQIAGGVWGLYRGAAETAGLIKYLKSTTGRYRQCVLADEVKLNDNTVYNDALEIINTALCDDDGFKISGRKTNGHYGELIEQIARLVKNVPDKKMLFERIIPEKTSIRAMASKYLTFEGNDNHRLLINYFRRELPEWISELTDIENCENYLSILSYLFNAICLHSGENIKTLVAKLTKLKHVDLKQAKEKFSAIQYQNEQAKKNQIIYSQNIDFGSTESILRSIIRCHHAISVSDNRNFEPWVEISDGGTIHTNRDLPDLPYYEESEIKVKETWANDYYLAPLKALPSLTIFMRQFSVPS